MSTKSNHGWTAFHIACNENRLDLVEVFIDNAIELSIDLNTRDSFGLTGFHQACIHGHTDLVDILLENAVKLNIDIDKKDDSYLLKPMELTQKLHSLMF